MNQIPVPPYHGTPLHPNLLLLLRLVMMTALLRLRRVQTPQFKTAASG
jgi:hypothetical protein